MKLKLEILIQASRTLAYIHFNDIVHRDVKSHNVLITENYTVKFCDFGLAKNKKELHLGNGQFSGTPAYMAPEMFLKRSYDEKVDVFAFGTMIWETIARKIPFEGCEVLDIKNNVVEGREIQTPDKIFTNKKLIDLIHLCRNKDHIKRPDFNIITKELIAISVEI